MDHETCNGSRGPSPTSNTPRQKYVFLHPNPLHRSKALPVTETEKRRHDKKATKFPVRPYCTQSYRAPRASPWSDTRGLRLAGRCGAIRRNRNTGTLIERRLSRHPKIRQPPHTRSTIPPKPNPPVQRDWPANTATTNPSAAYHTKPESYP